MNDHGEKIVNLARELIRSNMMVEPDTETPNTNISFKVLCLATMLTALGSSAITEWAVDNHRPINRYEKTELNALVFYTARMKGVDEDSLRHDVVAQLGVNSFDDLTQHEFQIARSYLQNKAQ